MSVKDANDGSGQFRQGLSRRTEQVTDYGPAQNNAATVLHIDLQVVSVSVLGVDILAYKIL